MTRKINKFIFNQEIKSVNYLIDIALTRVLKSENEVCSEGPALSWLLGEDCIDDLLEEMIIYLVMSMEKSKKSCVITDIVFKSFPTIQ